MPAVRTAPGQLVEIGEASQRRRIKLFRIDFDSMTFKQTAVPAPELKGVSFDYLKYLLNGWVTEPMFRRIQELAPHLRLEGAPEVPRSIIERKLTAAGYKSQQLESQKKAERARKKRSAKKGVKQSGKGRTARA